MRTTVTLDKDVERMLREAVHLSRKPFKQTLNSALRLALGGKKDATKGRNFVVKSRPMNLRTGVDPATLNRLADDLETEAIVAKRPSKRSV